MCCSDFKQAEKQLLMRFSEIILKKKAIFTLIFESRKEEIITDLS